MPIHELERDRAALGGHRTDGPTRLRALAITLASGVLAQIERSGAMTSGNVESERVDDYAVNYAAGADAFVGSLPPAEEERLRAQYGASAYVTGSRG